MAAAPRPEGGHGAKHIPALDGVRGLAIVLVIARHLSVVGIGQNATDPLIDRLVHSTTRVGWVGVDLFFVLSGFLITGILLDARGTPGAFPRFWKRRALRIFPLYYAVCAFLFFALPHIPYFSRDPATASLVAHQAWYWLYAVNFLEVLRGGSATPLNTSHFWSLAVEEQFYILWPLVVLLVSRRSLWRIVIGMIVAALAVRLALVFYVPRGWLAAYVLAPARMDILGAGAFVALAVRTPDIMSKLRRYSIPCATTALALLVVLSTAHPAGFDNENPYIATIGYSLIAVVGALLLALLVVEPGTPGWLQPLRGSLLRTFGKYSYCLYVIHYPLMVVLDLLVPRMGIPRPFGSSLIEWFVYGSLLVGTSLSIAWISWRVLESPMLSLKDIPVLPRLRIRPFTGGRAALSSWRGTPAPSLLQERDGSRPGVGQAPLTRTGEFAAPDVPAGGS